jgi:hypothetical protein
MLQNIKYLYYDNNIKVLIENFFINYIHNEKYANKEIIEEKFKEIFDKFNEKYEKSNNQDDLYYFITCIIYYLIKIFYSVIIRNKEEIRFYYQNRQFYYFIRLLCDYGLKFANNKNYSIVFENYKNYLKEHLQENNIYDLVKKYIDKMYKILSFDNFQLIKNALLLDNYKMYNKPSFDYNIFDFILAFIIKYTNVNDFTKLIIKADMNNVNLKANLNIYPLTNEITKEIENIRINEQQRRKLFPNNNGTFIYEIKSLFESDYSNKIYSSFDSKNTLIFKLSVLFLIKSKHLIYHYNTVIDKPQQNEKFVYLFKELLLTTDINGNKKYNFKLTNTTKQQMDILHMNFLNNFEKHMIKAYNLKNNKGVSAVNCDKIPINELVKIIKENSIKYNTFYDFNYFIDLFYYLLNDKSKLNNIIQLDIGKLINAIKNITEKIKPIVEKELIETQKKLKEKVKRLDEIKNHLTILKEKQKDADKEIERIYKIIIILINIITAETIDNKINTFINLTKILLINNKYLHHFTIQPHNRETKHTFEPYEENILYNKMYNQNYVNLNKAYDFVNDFNDLTNYFIDVFKNLNSENINMSTNKPPLCNFSDPYILEKIYSIFNEHQNYNVDEKTLIEKPENLHYKYIHENLISCGGDFIKSFLEEANKNYYMNNKDISIYTDIDYEILKTFLIEYFNKSITTEGKNKNFYIHFIARDNYFNNRPYNMHHSSCLIINLEKKYIDIYSSLGMKPFDDTKDPYKKIYKNILKFFEEDFFTIINELNDSDYKKKDFIINKYYEMMKMQPEYEWTTSTDNCLLFTSIYAFIRALYFDKADYTMNFIQEKINEYFISYNHPLYFLIVFTFLYFVRCCKKSKTLLYDRSSTIVYNNLVFINEEFNKNNANYITIYIFKKYREIIDDPKLIYLHNTNFDKIFRPLCKKGNKNIGNYNINIDNNDYTLNEYMKLQNIENLPQQYNGLDNNTIKNKLLQNRRNIKFKLSDNSSNSSNSNNMQNHFENKPKKLNPDNNIIFNFQQSDNTVDKSKSTNSSNSNNMQNHFENKPKKLNKNTNKKNQSNNKQFNPNNIILQL